MANIFAEAFDGQTVVSPWSSSRPPNFEVKESCDLEKFLLLEMDRQKFTAFAIASDDRLGEGSQAAKLDEEIRRMVWEMSNEILKK